MLWHIKKLLDHNRDFCFMVSKLYKTSERTSTSSYLWWTFNSCFTKTNWKSNRRKNPNSKTLSTCYWQTATTWCLLLWSTEVWMGKQTKWAHESSWTKEKKILKVLSDIWHKSLSEKNITSGFRATAIFPLNCETYPRDGFDQRLLKRYKNWVRLGKPEDIMEDLSTAVVTPN